MKLLAAALCAIALAACGTTAPPPPATPAPAPVAAVDTARVADLERTVAELLDRIEVLNARMQRLESGREPAALASAPVPAQAHHDATALQKSTPASPAAPPVAASRAPVQPQHPAASTGAKIADDYRAALALYGKSDFAGAREALKRVLDADPNGELADNAIYWIGETHFAAGSYSEAMKYYRRVFTDFPDQNKAPDAMFKLGLAYEKIGDLVLARSTFEELVQKYPYSTPASSARNEIKRIKY